MKLFIIMLLSGAIGYGAHYAQYGENPPCVELIKFNEAK